MLAQKIIFFLLYLFALGKQARVTSYSGRLYGNEPNQIFRIFIIYNDGIIPENIKNLTFINNKSEIFYANSYCVKENNTDYYPERFICILDLTKVPPGQYLISSYYYKDLLFFEKNYYFDIIKIEDKERKDVVFESLRIGSKIFEKKDNQLLKLFLYGKNIKASYIERLLLTYNKNIFYMPLKFRNFESNIYNFNLYLDNDENEIKPRQYYVYGLDYDGTFYNLSDQNIDFIIFKRKDLDGNITLLDIQGIGYYNEISSFNLSFNEEVDFNLFQEFSLKNVNNLQDYKINKDYKYSYSLSKSIQTNFDLEGIPLGSYTLKYKYLDKIYESKIILEIKERDYEYEKEKEKEIEKEKENVLIENKLLNFYGNLMSNKNSEYAFFSFNGKRNINLAYIILTDENKKKNVLQILDCKIVDYSDDIFDLKCMIDLSYISVGKYTLTEYYINNQHYFANIGVNVN